MHAANYIIIFINRCSLKTFLGMQQIILLLLLITVHGSNRTKYGRLESPHGERLPLKRRIDEVL